MSGPPPSRAGARPPGVILAGGRSSRMGGRDKAFLLLAGRPLIAHVTDRLAPQVSALAVNLTAGAALPGVAVLTDPVAGQPGPLAGVLAAMDWAAARGADRVVTVPVDAPFLPSDLVARLAAAPGAAVAADADGTWHPTVAIWPVAEAGTLAGALARGTRRVRAFAEAIGAVPVAFPDPAAFRNLNTPEDLAAADAMVQAARTR